ncbi:MAG: prepilin-type N-terminal cleavage/methylation domain-containing protein [Phycisphaerales bacterium]|nr:prepilin-type N-terminal cleavage/methylation domain-containing protein [Phycisphaerales bacterium]
MTGTLTRHPGRRHARGFTLIELMVTIGIIVALVALTLGVLVAVLSGSERRQTTTVLELLVAATESWQQSADRPITYGGATGYGGPGVIFYDINAEDAAYTPGVPLSTTVVGNLMTRYLAVLERDRDAQRILGGIDPKLLTRIPENQINPAIGTQRLVDAWGTPILVVFPGREMDPVLYAAAGDDFADADEDGTIRTPFENLVGVATQRVIAFVSAGPDGQFGDRQAPVDSAAYAQTLDNLSSYPLERRDAP